MGYHVVNHVLSVLNVESTLALLINYLLITLILSLKRKFEFPAIFSSLASQTRSSRVCLKLDRVQPRLDSVFSSRVQTRTHL